jgi:hypothetical protein
MSWARSLLWQTGLPRVSSAVRSYRAISAHIDETRHLYPHLKLTYHPSSSNEPPGVMPDMLSFTRYITPLQSRRVQRCRILGRAIGVMSGLLTFLRCRVVATDSRCCLVSGRALHECVHRSRNRQYCMNFAQPDRFVYFVGPASDSPADASALRFRVVPTQSSHVHAAWSLSLTSSRLTRSYANLLSPPGFITDLRSRSSNAWPRKSVPAC